jgi:hypothetical protein
MQTQPFYLPTNREEQVFWAAATGPVTVGTYEDLTASDIDSSPGDSRRTPTRRTFPYATPPLSRTPTTQGCRPRNDC